MKDSEACSTFESDTIPSDEESTVAEIVDEIAVENNCFYENGEDDTST